MKWVSWGLLALSACGAGEATLDTAETTVGTGTATGVTPTATATSGGTPTGGTSGGTTSSVSPDFRTAGPYAVAESSTSVSASCNMSTGVYLPQGTSPLGFVVLSHGFQRSQGVVADWARHWASWGLAVVTPDLCHASIFDTDHAQNGLDLIQVAQQLGQGGDVAYVGHSAGGLATFLAAEADPAAVAWFGLDPVDATDLGASVAGSIGVPAYALFSPGNTCNSAANAEGWYDAIADGQALRITDSDHCDFESPTDFLCTFACPAGGANDDAVREIVRGQTTAFLMWQLGLEPAGEQWWTPGQSWYDDLGGSVTPI